MSDGARCHYCKRVPCECDEKRSFEEMLTKFVDIVIQYERGLMDYSQLHGQHKALLAEWNKAKEEIAELQKYKLYWQSPQTKQSQEHPLFCCCRECWSNK